MTSEICPIQKDVEPLINMAEQGCKANKVWTRGHCKEEKKERGDLFMSEVVDLKT